MVTIRMGDIFTEDEIKQMAALVANGASASLIASEVIEPVIERVNLATGQQNDPLYLAFAVQYQIESVVHKKGVLSISS